MTSHNEGGTLEHTPIGEKLTKMDKKLLLETTIGINKTWLKEKVHF